nr:PEP-CTERM sorting domain-containing protein [uncultured Desulfobulbus sp.]
MNKRFIATVTLGLVLTAGVFASAQADTIIDNNTYGYYNDNLGNIDSLGITDDTTVAYSTAPDWSSAATDLGDWLTSPGSLNSNWSATAVLIPSTWSVYEETAVIYEINAGVTGLSNVIAKFGVDNGLFVWLDGQYLYGWRSSGGSTQWEYSLDLGTLSAGTHYLQLLREDHGGATGFDIEVTADASSPVPEPATMLLFGAGIAGLSAVGRKKR